MNAQVATSKIAVLGAGSWGTTLAILLAENEHDVALWEFLPEQAAAIVRDGENKKFLAGVKIPAEIAVTSNLEEAIADADVIVFVVPSHVVRPVATQVCASTAFNGTAIAVNAAKGIEEGTSMCMSAVLGEVLPLPEERIAVLVGPSHAEEVSRSIPTSVVAASVGESTRIRVQEVFLRPYFRVYTNDDVIGVEVGVSLKNSIAIAAGILDGLGCGDNTKAALVTRGLAEMARLGEAMGGVRETFSGLAGVGDLVVTCLSRHSRNRHVGEALGRGRSLDEILSEMVMVAEGVRTTRAAVALGEKYGVELPIIEMVHRVLFDNHDPREAINLLMTRPPRQEMSGQPSDDTDRR